jgi:hypothetical protein
LKNPTLRLGKTCKGGNVFARKNYLRTGGSVPGI